MPSWYSWPNEELLEILVTVQPRASKPGVHGLHAGRFKLRVKAAPTDGKANKEAGSFLASLFNVPPSRVLLTRGVTNRHKVFRIQKPLVRPDTIKF